MFWNGFTGNNESRVGSWFILLIILTVLAVWTRSATAAIESGQSGDQIWYDVEESTIEAAGARRIVPEQYRTLAVDLHRLSSRLDQAPMEFSPESGAIIVSLPLPLPDGSNQNFRIFESPVMAPGLRVKFPEITSYYAVGIDDPHASGRLDRTPNGFHAMIFSSAGTFYIDPYSTAEVTHYISYFKGDYQAPEDMVFEELGPLGNPTKVAPSERMESGENLRIYRLAQATTGEYSIFHGGTIPSVMAEVVTAINRVTGIYEREVAVRLELIPNNDQIIYLNPATDPYTNDNGVIMLGENQANLDAVIGNSNYDIGHVFSTGGGGVAYLGVVCQSGWKARGVTGLSSPIGDPFYVDYVAHEMGHQHDGNHSFNGNAGSCSGGNRNASTAFEPGSGSTIMAYAGICGSQNLQLHSDDYFHTINFDEIVSYTAAGQGATCGTVISTGNNPPVVEAGTGGFFIPIQTPFTLSGSATDPDGDPLTYSWEEFDLGPAGHPNAPVGNAPIFRSFPATGQPSRTFPQISDIVNNTQTIGEILPTYSRDLTFRLTARDNHTYPGAGGVAHDTIAFDVTDQAGPFRVTGPNTNIIWPIWTWQDVTWDVANTDAAPVNCQDVNISLSTDGGYTYPHALATAVANDGLHPVMVPYLPSNSARVKVACADNVFFDISNANFTIVDSAQRTFLPLMIAELTTTIPPRQPILDAGHAAASLEVGSIVLR